MSCLIKFALRHRNFVNFTECKRFAGHSKWANIRHTKMEKDMEKSAALQNYIQKMRIAIAEGKSAKPEDNVRLARIIEQAKEKSLPMATLKNFLEKAQKSKIGGSIGIFESRGPSGCIVLIQILSDSVPRSRNSLNSHLKKANFSPSETPVQSMYEEKGIILTEIGDRDIDKALEDAIEAGAEEAERLKENDKEFFQFTCYANELFRIRNKLEALNYKIIQADIEYIPKVCVTLTDEEMEMVSKLYDRLNSVEEVVKIYTNIA